MRRLSRTQAQQCEDGAGRRCRCRCGGELHGAQRGEVMDLPIDDPHCPMPWQQLALPLRALHEAATAQDDEL